jgi:ketosteroid isomerase-like protein
LVGVVALLGSPVSGVSAQAAAAPGGGEDAVREVELARAQALLRADTVALSRMTAEEFIEISRFGTIRTRADNIREIAAGVLRLSDVRYDSLSVRVYGEVALLTGIADNSGTFQGTPFTGRIRYTRVFVYRDGRWQAIAMQHTMMASP